MTSDQLEAEFATRGRQFGGVLLFELHEALALVERAHAVAIPILGIDAFRIDGTRLQPLLEYSVDLSGSTGESTWKLARAHLLRLKADEVQVEVVF